MRRTRALLNGIRAILCLLPMATISHAWGPEIHHVIGLLALEQLEEPTAGSLKGIMSTQSAEDMAAACNWPDEYRETEQGAWSAPQHYINVPAGKRRYEPARDCPDGLCVSGAITRYAAELTDTGQPAEVRRQAWSRICHFIGDIHQPLHVGYAEDRGGNEILVTWRTRQMDLHDFWDHALLEENYDDWRELTADLSQLIDASGRNDWSPTEADLWASESHELVRRSAYPPGPEITETFAAESWLLARARSVLASERLARVTRSALEDP